MEDALSDGLGDNLSDILGNNPSEPEPTTQSEVASMLKTMEEHREMLNDAIEQNTQLCVQNGELMEANQECGRAKEVDNFLDTLRSNFQSHTHLFLHGDPDKVKYAASLLSMWKNHRHPAQRQTQMTDPVEWLRDLRRDSDPWLEDFEALSE
jgi:tRNA A37 N6-isopentenylltransferase MiaA